MFRVQEYSNYFKHWSYAIIAHLDGRSKTWGNCEFKEKRDAEVYAWMWCNVATKEQAIIDAPEMQIGVAYDYRGPLSFNEEVLMRIIEVNE